VEIWIRESRGEYSVDGKEVYKRITLEPGEIREALTDWINKKKSGSITPNWNTFSFQTRYITEEPLWSLRIEGIAKVLMPEKKEIKNYGRDDNP
tara:strand:+ start:6855 stop:7136 length:282 start_codon:yes stop_codon:yes gene_type:complete